MAKTRHRRLRDRFSVKVVQKAPTFLADARDFTRGA